MQPTENCVQEVSQHFVLGGDLCGDFEVSAVFRSHFLELFDKLVEIHFFVDFLTFTTSPVSGLTTSPSETSMVAAPVERAIAAAALS